MTKFLSDIILSVANDIQFQTTAGANAGKISQVGDDLVLSNAVGDILLGNGSDDIFIGDGTSTVDIRFEQNMAIFADSSSTRTLTLGGNNTNLVLESPTLNSATLGATTINNKLTFTGSTGYIVFDYEPSGDTGEYSTEVPLLKIDKNGSEKTILSRVSENGAIQLGHDDTVLITAGDVGDVMKTNWTTTNENVVLASEAGFYAYGFPNNDTTWSNRNEFRFRSDSSTASDNGLYIGDGGNTQFIDLSRNLKNIGTISSGDITISDTSPTLKLTDTDHNDDWSIANNNGDFRIYNETDGLAYLIADEDNVSINIGDGVNVTYDGISGGNVQSGVQTTGNSGTVVRGGFLNPASEANMVHIPHMINDLAGFNRWSNGTIVTSGFYSTRSGSSGSYSYSNEIASDNAGWANAFDAHSSTAGSWYSDNGTDGVYTHGVDTPGTVELQWTNEITYSLVVGIVFGSTSFTATYVKIEAYKGDGSGGFAWQTLCEITNNTDQVILRKVDGNSGTGSATKRLKYTLGGSVNESYFRIHSLYMTNYAAGNNNLNNTGTDTTRGVNFLERYKDGFLHGHLRPGADDTYDLGSNSYKWKDSYFDGIVYSDRVHSQGTFPQYNIVDDPSGGGSSRTMQLGMSGTSLYFKKNDATGNVFFRNTNNTDLMTIGLADDGQVTVLNELEAGSLDINGNADISGTTTTSGNITATANNATISAAESGGATTKIMGASVGRVGTSSNHNLEILSNNTAAITVDTSQKVGIGVSPTNTLDVRGASSVNGTTLGIDNTYGESPKVLQFTYNGNIPVAKVIGFGRHSTGNLPYFAIEVNDTTSSAASTSTTERLRITNEGRVGIGTETPAGLLDVAGSATFSGNVTITGGSDIFLADNGKTHYGANNDLEVYHNGSHSYIVAKGTGDLILEQQTDDADIIFKTDDGNGGTTTYMTIDGGSEKTKLDKPLLLKDSVALQLGTDTDATLYHSGGEGTLENNTGNFRIIQNADDGDIIFKCDDGNGSTTEYFRVDGGATKTMVTKAFQFFDNTKAEFGDSSDLQIYHDGSNSYIDDTGTGNLVVRANGQFVAQKYTGETLFKGIADGAFEAYHNNVKKLETTSGGIDVTGSVVVSGNINANGNIIGDDSTNITNIGRIEADSYAADADNTTTINMGASEISCLVGDTDVFQITDSDFTYDPAIKVSIHKRKLAKTSNTDGDADGDIIYIGNTGTTVGKIYHFKSDATWEEVDANSAAKCDGMLAVALGSNSTTNGMLLRGMVTLNHSPGNLGDVLFASAAATGQATGTAPAGNGDIVRVIGYQLDADNGQIYFNPDGTFVEVTA